MKIEKLKKPYICPLLMNNFQLLMDSLTFKVFLLVNDIYVHRFECIICSMVISFIPIVFEKQYPFIYILLARPRIFSKISSIFEIPCFRLTYFFFIVACLFSLRLSLRRPRLSVRTRFYLRLRSFLCFESRKLPVLWERKCTNYWLWKIASILIFRERYTII